MNSLYEPILVFPKFDPLTAPGMALFVDLGPKCQKTIGSPPFMAQKKILFTKPSYLSINSNETVQNSKSKPKKFSFLCTFKQNGAANLWCGWDGGRGVTLATHGLGRAAHWLIPTYLLWLACAKCESSLPCLSSLLPLAFVAEPSQLVIFCIVWK